jgi:hypothetical protein
VSLNRPYLVWLLVWGAGIYAALMIFFIPGEFSHEICGPWGCYPELQPLAALHTAWLAALLPPVVWAARAWPVRWVSRAGWTLIALGILGVAGMACREALTWLPQVPEDWRRYFHLRLLYVVVMLIDVPLTQTVVAGIVCCVMARRRVHRSAGVPLRAAS